MKKILTSIAGKVLDIVKEIVPDKDKHKELETKVKMAIIELAPQIVTLFSKELDAQKSVLMAETQSGNWLAASWRPLLMLWFALLLGLHWFGFTPVNMSDDILIEILQILKYGITGYIIGRSGEKITNTIKTFRGSSK